VSDVRIAAELVGRENGRQVNLKFEGVTLRASIDLWKCERCAALTLREDSAKHEAACAELMAGADEDALNSVEALRSKLMSLDGGRGTWALHHLHLIERALRAKFDA
jgi:hypothetical protein